MDVFGELVADMDDLGHVDAVPVGYVLEHGWSGAFGQPGLAGEVRAIEQRPEFGTHRFGMAEIGGGEIGTHHHAKIGAAVA
ncbi:hypothetical protein [Saccharopolyspora sp. SCSIO 74807]|uniref:hypothetical protein n=1 Tax=Saccharopolyspora sp. SCSIO 74807 TaxID=3118084 RepID=UPI0030CABC31